MKVLIAHNRYRQYGGEDSVVHAERDLLLSRGHSVRLVTVDNRQMSGPLEHLRVAWTAPGSRFGFDLMCGAIAEHRPDVVHVHNTFPLLTPAVFDACCHMGVPVVLTLHNYRLICPGALLMRGGLPCEECVTGSPYRAVLHRCYRGSFGASLAASRVVAVHRKRGTWNDKVTRFIALTRFSRERFVAGGLPAERIVVKPNCVAAPEGGRGHESRSGALYVGRLSGEKGIAVLAEAWQGLTTPLRVAGHGPEMDRLEKGAGPSVTTLGPISRERVADEMARAAFLVVPSINYENFPMVLVEAYSSGLPVIASRIGALAELVVDGVTGLLFEPGNPRSLAEAVRWAEDHPQHMRQMGVAAYGEYQKKYTPEINYRSMLSIYEDAIGANDRT